MNINRTNFNSKLCQNISFNGKIIDSHMHLGQWQTDGVDSFEPQSLNRVIDKPFDVNINGKTQQDEVEKVLISNLSCIESKDGKPIMDEISGNKELLEQCIANKKFNPLAVCQPGHGNAKNIKKLLKDNPNVFKGFKLHPEALELDADNAAYKPYLNLANKHKMPCLFHSDKPNSFADPEKIYRLAKNQPQTPVILGHIGLGDSKAIEHGANILKQSIENSDAKLYADISWAREDDIVKTIKTIGTENVDRLLFGTDAPLGEFGDPKKIIPNYYSDRVSNVKTAISIAFPDKAKEMIDKIFYKNSQEIFFKNDLAKNTVKNTNGKAFTMIGTGFALVAGGLYYIKNKTSNSKQHAMPDPFITSKSIKQELPSVFAKFESHY